VRLVWKSRALRQLETAAEWSPKQARAVVDAMEQMAQSGWSLGRPVGHGRRYMPVRPLGVFYRVIGDALVVVSVVDARRLRVLPGSPLPAIRSEEDHG